jgi:hypothetical protein
MAFLANQLHQVAVIDDPTACRQPVPVLPSPDASVDDVHGGSGVSQTPIYTCDFWFDLYVCLDFI